MNVKVLHAFMARVLIRLVITTVYVVRDIMENSVHNVSFNPR